MKKILPCFCTVMAALILSACVKVEIQSVELPELPQTETEETETLPADTPSPSPEITPEPSPEIIIEEPDAAEAPDEAAVTVTVPLSEAVHVSVQYSPYEQQFSAPDNDEVCILSFSYNTPEVFIDGNAEASEKINEAVSLTNELFYSGDEDNVGISYSYEAALDAYTYAAQTGNDVNYQFFANRVFRTLRADGKFISFLVINSSFLGENDYKVSGMTFSAVDGSEVTPEDWITDTEKFNAAVSEYAPDPVPEDVTIIDSIVGLDDSGVVFLFTSDASDTFSVPYSVLEDSISSDLIPDNYEEDGEMTLSYADPGAENSVDIIACVIHDTDGDDLILAAEGTVYNVRITEVTYIDDEFHETDELWYSDYLSDCGVQLKTVLPEGMPNIRVEYRDSSHTVFSKLVSWNGQTGEPVLTDDSVSAVG